MKAVTDLKKENREKVTFRIVKEHWYHRLLDNFFFEPWSKEGVSYQQIHLSTTVMKRKNKWFLTKPFQKITVPMPTTQNSIMKEWAHNNDILGNGLAPTGFEIDPWEYENEDQEQKEEQKKEQKKDQKEKSETMSYIETLVNKETASIKEKLAADYAAGNPPSCGVNDITSLDDFPIEVLLKLCDDPDMVKLIAGLNPSLDILEAMTKKIMERIKELKENHLQDQKETPTKTEEDTVIETSEKKEDTIL